MDDLLDVLTLDQLRARTSVRWSHYPDDVLPLWVAEMDVPLAEPVRQAVRALLDAHDVGYPPEDGALTTAFAGFAARRWGWTVDATAVRQLTDVMTAVQTAVAAVVAPGDVVIVPTPVYGPFRWYTEGAGRRVEAVPLRDDRLDVAAIDATAARVRAEVGPGAGIALLLCNPHNPTGVVHSRDELAPLADVAARHHVRGVSDEAHAPLVLPGSPAYVPYLEVDPRGLAVHSAAKAWNLAGFKSALLVAGEEAHDVLPRVPAYLSDAVGHVSMAAHAAAYREGTRGSTSCCSRSRGAATCWSSWSGSICRARVSGCLKQRISVGWTCVRQALTAPGSATIRRRCSSWRGGWRWREAWTSGRAVRGTFGSTMRPGLTC